MQRVFASELHGVACVVKERFAKGYRHPTLDARLRRSRLLAEARALFRARKAGVDTPALLLVDDRPDSCRLYLERIDGQTVKAVIQQGLDKEGEFPKTHCPRSAGCGIAL